MRLSDYAVICSTKPSILVNSPRIGRSYLTKMADHSRIFGKNEIFKELGQNLGVDGVFEHASMGIPKREAKLIREAVRVHTYPGHHPDRVHVRELKRPHEQITNLIHTINNKLCSLAILFSSFHTKKIGEKLAACYPGHGSAGTTTHKLMNLNSPIPLLHLSAGS